VEFSRLARDRDALQFRADATINESVRQAAARFSGQRVTLLDAEALFATNSPQGLTGAEFFYEHVHLTPEGNYLLARAIAERAARALSLETNVPWVSESECLRLLGFTEWNRYDALQVILDRIQGAPFTNQLDHVAQLRRISDQLAQHRLASKPAHVRLEAAQVSQLVARFPEDPDLRWNLAGLLELAGDELAAEEQWRRLINLQPQAVLPTYNLAKLLDRMGRKADALPLYSATLKLDPEYFPARYGLGLLYLQFGDFPNAIEQLSLAVRQKPASAEARAALNQALAHTRERYQ
jgi:tetratricopeptide (TPR) repeat protein